MTFTPQAAAETPLLEFYVTAKWRETNDPSQMPKGMWFPISVYVTKMARFYADPNENVGAFADRVCATLVAKRPLRAQSKTAAIRAREFFRKMQGMQLIYNGRPCDESKTMRDYHWERMPYLELEVRGV